MYRLGKFIFTIAVILTTHVTVLAQDLIQNEEFKYIPVSQGKAILIKEIPLKYPYELNGNYNKLKNWVKQNYTTDIVNSGIKYNSSKYAVYVKSKIDLLLPLLNVNGSDAKAKIRYYMHAHIDKDKCVIIFSDITYRVSNTYPPVMGRVKAEEFVTNEVLLYNDEYKQQRSEVQKGSLHYFNNLVQSLTKAVNEPIY